MNEVKLNARDNNVKELQIRIESEIVFYRRIVQIIINGNENN